MYSKGDILTIIWSETPGSTSGTNSTGFVSVDALSFGEWSWGCPFSPMENRILSEKEVEDAGDVVGYEANSSSLKGIKSSVLPPPLARIITSGLFLNC